MIIGRAFCKVLDKVCIEVSDKPVGVKTNMGNQDALDKFIAESDAKRATKYPLLFYIINKVYKEHNGWKYCNTDLLILMSTDENLLYKKRTDLTYVKYIEPIYQKSKQVITANPYIQVFGATQADKFPYIDMPNYGIVEGKKKKSEESAVTDYVDARIINIDFRINTNCIK